MPAAILLLTAVSLHAQNRGRMTVFVPMPTGGSQAQRSYFQENFKMELLGANYPSVDAKAEAIYTLFLVINDNPDFISTQPEDDDNNRFLLDIKLERSIDNAEIVHFDFPFNDTEAMSNWNLFLLYQAMANAYLPEEESAPAPVIDNRWRNKWVYINLGVGLDAGMFIHSNNRIRMGSLYPFPLVGWEFQLLNGLSVEPEFKLRMEGVLDEFILSPSIDLLFKGIIKPHNDLMLEPYAGVEYSLNVGGRPAWFSVLAGAQLGSRGGSRSAWTLLDAGITWGPIDGLVLADGDIYNLLRIHILTGWKVGFGERKTNE
jgi:hypothetical protein